MTKAMKLALGGTWAAMGLVTTAGAQGLVPLVPFEAVADAYVVDSTADKLYGFADLNLDGDFGDALESFVFYDDTIGAQVLSNPTGLAVGNGARFYVADRGTGRVLRFLDSDGDRTAHDPGEAVVFFDGDPLVNQSGLTVEQPVRLLVDASETVWVTESNAMGGADAVLRLRDLTFDGDANDAGEASRFFAPDPGAVPGDTVVADVDIGLDGRLYYVEASTTGFRAPGIYRLDDADASGTIDAPGEVSAWFTVPTQPNPVFLQSLASDGAGAFYLTDTGNDLVWRAEDLNADGDANDVGEASVFFTLPSSAIFWDAAPRADGRVLVCGEDGLGELIVLDDADASGVVDPGEAATVFLAGGAGFLPNPRAAAWELRPMLEMPTAASVGGVGAGLLTTGASDLVFVYHSLALMPPLTLPPFGTVLLDLNPGVGFARFVQGTASLGGSFPIGFTVPNDPALAGLTVHWQAAAGKVDRLLLSNLQSLSIL